MVHRSARALVEAEAEVENEEKLGEAAMQFFYGSSKVPQAMEGCVYGGPYQTAQFKLKLADAFDKMMTKILCPFSHLTG